MPRVLILLFLTFINLDIFANGASTSTGIFFENSALARQNSSRLGIPSNGNIRLEGDFKLSFDLDPYATELMGHIMRTIVNDAHTLDLIYDPMDQECDAQLLLIWDGEIVLSKVPIAFNHQKQLGWQSVSIQYQEDKISFEMGEQKWTKALSLPKGSAISLNFGACKKEGFGLRDIPSFALRNIALWNGKHHYSWPLNQSKGSVIMEAHGRLEGYIEHPHWQAQEHHYWEKKWELSTSFHPAIIFNQKGEYIQILDQFSSKKIPLKTEKLEEKPLHLYSPNTPILHAFQKENEMLFWDARGAIPQVFDSLKSDFQLQNDGPMDFWHRNYLYHEPTDQILALNGYGVYKFRHFPQVFDEGQWHDINLQGDTMTPRYLMAMGMSNENEALLFGGMGNSSGAQSMGSKTYHDLWKLNLKERSLERLWNIDLHKTEYLPSRELIVEEGGDSFYTLLHPAHQFNTGVVLAEISIKTGSVKWVSDTIPTPYRDVNTQIHLFQQKSTKNFYACVSHGDYEQNQSLLSIYELKGPPISLAKLQDMNQRHLILNTLPKVGYFVAGGLLFLLLSMGGFLIYRNKKKDLPKAKPFNAQKIKHYESLITKPLEPQANSLYLFNEFQLYDREGNEISNLITEKLRQLFCIILFYPHLQGRAVHSNELAELLWPGTAREKTKNNRSISVRRLRLILEKCEGISIEHDNGDWRVKMEKDFYCDYQEFLNYQDQLKFQDGIGEAEFKAFFAIVASGKLVQGLRIEWLEDSIGQLKSETIDFLVRYAENCENPLWVEKITDCIFKFDDLEEQALTLKIKALLFMDKTVQAHHEYEKFNNQYLKLFGESYNKSFKEVVK
ncbi:hypothetical protein [Persicobacter diffluens]|uniref:DNA-binding transcriptional activator n=1 Tax=Persicobacter diffluens TaxID=981 RepID=A0AAN4W1D9_9BACT|nr:hypothetical protein PEDI_38590 [Persicobacter diffluens]